MFNNIKPVYIKVVGDALLPLLGYFLWDWTLYFILIFYILDLLVGEALVHLKTKKIKSYSEKVDIKSWIKKGVLSLSLILIALIGIHFSMTIIDPEIVFTSEIYDFLSYEEMGIAQGYVLLPLIIFMGYSQYRNEFIQPKLFRIVEFSELWKSHILSRILICVLILILTIVASFIEPIGMFYVLAIVICTSAYQLYMAKT